MSDPTLQPMPKGTPSPKRRRRLPGWGILGIVLGISFHVGGYMPSLSGALLYLWHGLLFAVPPAIGIFTVGPATLRFRIKWWEALLIPLHTGLMAALVALPIGWVNGVFLVIIWGGCMIVLSR